MARILSILLFCYLTLVGVISQGTPRTLVPNDQYDFFYWNTGSLPVIANPQFSVTFPETGFVTISDFECSGDEFTLLVDGREVGKTSVPLIRSCGVYTRDWNQAVRDPRFSSERFFAPLAGTYTLSIKVNSGSYQGGGGVIKARTAVCQGPPSLTTDDFALVSRLVPGTSAAETCQAFGFDLADITSNNVGLAAQTANYCLKVMKETTQNHVFVNSWNTDTYGGVSLGLYLQRASPTQGSISGSDGANHYALCQKARTTSVVGNPTTCVIAGQDGPLAVVRPIGFSNDIVNSCGCAKLVPAVLSGARPEEFLAATSLVFSTIGMNGRVWIGGWEVTKSPDNPNQNLALHAGSGAPGGSVSIPVSDPAEPGMLKLAYLCTSPEIIKTRRSAEPVNDEL